MDIFPIQTGHVQVKSRHRAARFGPRLLRMLDVLADSAWAPRMPITCWAITHPEGLIVVDTGETSHANDSGYQPWWHPFMRFCERRWVAPEEEVAAALARLGARSADVRWVVMTHMHGDHAGGLGHFRNSEVVMTDREAAMALAPSGPLQGYLNMHYPEWLRPRAVRFESGPWESFDRSTLLTEDGRVRLLPTPGHTLGHLSVAVDLGTYVVLLGGDAAYCEAALLAGSVDGVAHSTAAHRDSTARLRSLCDRRPVITQFAHDPGNARRLADRTATVAG